MNKPYSWLMKPGRDPERVKRARVARKRYVKRKADFDRVVRQSLQEHDPNGLLETR